MSDRAPTKTPFNGIPIEDCTTCGHRHPITRRHCGLCGLACLFRCAHPDCEKTQGGTSE